MTDKAHETKTDYSPLLGPPLSRCIAKLCRPYYAVERQCSRASGHGPKTAFCKQHAEAWARHGSLQTIYDQ